MSTAPRLNILYIFTDQQHHRAMRCAGNPDVATGIMGRRHWMGPCDGDIFELSKKE